jgi:hypothetical protein
MLLKTHLDIISRNEPIQRKARFWTSYMRALKGTSLKVFSIADNIYIIYFHYIIV